MSGRFDQVPLINKTDDKDYFIRTSLHDPGEDVHDVFIREHMWRKQKCCRILGLIASVLLVIVATASVAYYFLFLQNAKVVEPPSPPNQHQAQGTGGPKTEEIIVEVTNNFNGDNEKKPGLENEIVGTDKDSSEDTDDLYKFENEEDMDEKEDIPDEASDFESYSTEYNDNSDSLDQVVNNKASKESSETEVVEFAYVDGAEEPIKTDINKDTNDEEYLNNGDRSSNGDNTDFGDNLYQSGSRKEGNQEGTVNSNWVDTTDNGNGDITSDRSDNDEKSLLNSYPNKNTNDFDQYLETSDSSEKNSAKSPRIGESYRTESRDSAFGEKEDNIHTENDTPLLNSKEMTDKAKDYYIDSGGLDKEGSMEEDDDVWSRIFGSDIEQNEDTYTYNSEDGGSFGYSKLWQDSEG